MPPAAQPAAHPPVARREIFSWCLYDFANSAFSVIVTTVVFSRYFQQYVVPGDVKLGSLLWGMSISVSMVIVALSAPITGAMADYAAGKKKGLALFTAVAVAGTAALAAVGPGDVAAGILLFVLANAGFYGAFAFYNGFLPEITTPSTVGRVSGFGYALGYIGGLACLALCLPLLYRSWTPENLPAVRASFLVTAAYFGLFSLPIFLWLRERRAPGPPIGTGQLVRIGFRRIVATLKGARRYKDLVRLLVAYIVYNDGIETVIFFSPVFASASLGFSDQEILLLFAAVQASAFAGAWALAGLTDRLGAKRMVAATVVVWALVTLWAFFLEKPAHFWAVAILGGIVLGPCQAASRSAFASLIPEGRSAEFFGLFAISGKVSAILGPAVFGWATWLFGGHRAGILSTLVFFVAGFLLLAGVDLDRGRRAAAEA